MCVHFQDEDAAEAAIAAMESTLADSAAAAAGDLQGNEHAAALLMGVPEGYEEHY